MDLNPNILQSNLFIPGPWGNEKMCIQKNLVKRWNTIWGVIIYISCTKQAIQLKVWKKRRGLVYQGNQYKKQPYNNKHSHIIVGVLVFTYMYFLVQRLCERRDSLHETRKVCVYETQIESTENTRKQKISRNTQHE